MDQLELSAQAEVRQAWCIAAGHNWGESRLLRRKCAFGIRGVGEKADEIDAGVLARHAELRGADFLGPVGVEPDVGVEVGVGGLVAEIGADKFLEVAAFFTLCLGGGAVGGEDALEGSHVWRRLEKMG